jgi:hypothetical protein
MHKLEREHAIDRKGTYNNYRVNMEALGREQRRAREKT